MSGKRLKTFVSLLCVVAMSFQTGCLNSGHKCVFTQEVVEEQYFATKATCLSGAMYYKSCECGKHGEETFAFGPKGSHDYTAEVVEEQYLKKAANCIDKAEYYKSCSVCGDKSTFSTFTYGEAGVCNYTEKVVDDKYLKSEATHTQAAVYYKSCVCGNIGEETFTYGDKLRSDYTDEEKAAYMATSLTVSLYDTQNSIYGFTYNTLEKPLRPVIQIQEGTALTEGCKEYEASVQQASSYDKNDKTITYYIVKAEIPLEIGKTYCYRAWDKYVQVGTETAILQAKDTKATSFTFAHVSDSQMGAADNSGEGSGMFFAQTLSQIVGSNDFIVHTGDIVEWSKYEGYWTAMLNDNFSYLSRIPMQVISGNHDTSVYAGKNEIYKHFNNKIPEQETTDWGYYYSFIYGNTKFIMLNTNDLKNNKLKDAQYDWLINELENNTSTWTVVAMHNPMYSVGKYGSDPGRKGVCLALRGQLQGVFARYGVDIVLQGHDHVISRTYPIDATGNPKSEEFVTENGVQYSVDPSGVIYVMHGPASNQVRSPYATDDTIYKYQRYSEARSWAEFTVDGNKMVVSVNHYDGTIKKNYMTWGIQKSAK